MLERLNGIFAFAIWDDERRRALPRPRPARRQAALLHERDGDVLLRLGGQGAAARCSARRRSTPRRARRLPDVPLGAGPRHAVRGHPQAAARPLRVVRATAGCEIREYWDLRFAPEERSEARVGRRRCATRSASAVRSARWSPTSRSAASSAAASTRPRSSPRWPSGRRPVTTYTVGFDQRGPRARDRPRRRAATRAGSAREFGADYHERILEPGRRRPAAEAGLAPRRAGRRPGRDLDLPDLLGGARAADGDAERDGRRRDLRRLPAPSRRPDRRGCADALPAALRARLRAARRAAGSTLGAPGPAARAAAQPAGSSCAGSTGRRSSATSPTRSYYRADELADAAQPGRCARELAGHDPLARHRGYLERGGATSTGSTSSSTSTLKTFLPCLNLTYTDKMSMAASVEVRVPLLDDELVELSRPRSRPS